MPDALQRGVANLLGACAGARPGQRLLIVAETTGYYEGSLAPAVAEGAGRLGLEVTLMTVPFEPEATELPDAIAARFDDADHVLFLARIGDQLRFKTMPRGARPIVSYVLETGALASPLGTACHHGFGALKRALDDLFAAAGRIHVTCPLGTDYAGTIAAGAVEAAEAQPDVAIRRFPMSVFSPINAATFSGRVAVAHCLAGTGARYYTPYGLALERPSFARVEANRLTAWEGEPETIARIAAHYSRVSQRYGIEPDFVHSWHAGIHPGCRYSGHAIDDLARWSGSAFGNPRLLHFHTCGAEPPGEICWNVVDPTVTVDGVAIWDRGRLHPERFAAGRDILAAKPDLAALFAAPCREIGL